MQEEVYSGFSFLLLRPILVGLLLGAEAGLPIFFCGGFGCGGICGEGFFGSGGRGFIGSGPGRGGSP